MKYTEYAYLYPPRPENKIMKGLLGVYERKGFVAQIKKNGTCNVVAVAPDKRLVVMNRHAETHKLWTPTDNSKRVFERVPGTGWSVFVAELLHSKTVHIKDTNYIFDVLVYDGEYLVGSTFAERQELLRTIFLPMIRKTQPDEVNSHVVIDDHTWLAKVHTGGFLKMFENLEASEDEGIVLKDPKAKLDMCSREMSNNRWQIKCRRPHKNYSF